MDRSRRFVKSHSPYVLLPLPGYIRPQLRNKGAGFRGRHIPTFAIILAEINKPPVSRGYCVSGLRRTGESSSCSRHQRSRHESPSQADPPSKTEANRYMSNADGTARDSGRCDSIKEQPKARAAHTGQHAESTNALPRGNLFSFGILRGFQDGLEYKD